MSISPPPFSPARSQASDDENDYFRDEDHPPIDSARKLVSSFDLYRNAIDRLRSSSKSTSTEEQQKSLEEFKPLSTRTNAWLYMRMHDDLLNVLLIYIRQENLPIQSAALSILANIACERASHEQIFETDLIDIVCRKVKDIDHIDVKNRCFRLLGNVCTVEEVARKMIDADLAKTMGDVLRTCKDAPCLHSTIRCSRKLSSYAVCRDRMLDSMCLLSICKQLFAETITLRKEAMKAVSEWIIDNSERIRSQLCEGEIFRFLIPTIESQSDKEYRHIALRLLNDLLRYGDMRTEFGHRQGLDFLLKMIKNKQYQSTYEHFKFLGLYCVCCQEVSNRRYIKDDPNKLKLLFDYLENYQYRSNFLDLMLTALVQFVYDDHSLMIFVKQMQFIERMCNLLETAVLVKYENNDKEQNNRKRLKTEHTTSQQTPRAAMMIDFNEKIFTEFVENADLDDERQTSIVPPLGPLNVNIEHRRRSESLILILLSKLSYETTESSVRRHLYSRRLISLLLRYIVSSDEPNPRSVRILHRLTKQIDCAEYLTSIGLPYLFEKHFHRNQRLTQISMTISSGDQFLFEILLNDNRAFFQRLSWTNEENRLKSIEVSLMKNIEQIINSAYMLNELVRLLKDPQDHEKFSILLTLVATLKRQHFRSILFDRCSALRYLIDHSDQDACFWAFRTLFHRCQPVKKTNYLNDYFQQLKTHSSIENVTENEMIELKINDEHSMNVNIHLLIQHSDYFRGLFLGSFMENRQKKIVLQLPETIPAQSFEHLIEILTNDQQKIELNRINDLFHLCDQYLFDYLPYRLVSYVLDQFIQGHFIETIDIVSKPNLVSSLVRACFSHLLTCETNISTEIFFKLMKTYPEELRTLTLSSIEQKSWFHEEYSPFLFS